jgi:hypothetical protein
MPGTPGSFIPGMAVPVVQRGHSRHPVFFYTSDHHTYLDICMMHSLVMAASCMPVN